ncbi:hypothetical protein KGQ64_14660 [bacterium]|nr:hypothetical protein [bacterium]
MAEANPGAGAGVRRWICVLGAGLSLLLAWQGIRTGEWRAVVVSEVQVLVVAAAAWIGFR